MTLNYQQYKESGFMLPSLPLDVNTRTNIKLVNVPKDAISHLISLGWTAKQLKRKSK